MRIIVMGTGPFAVPSTNRLLALGYDIPLVVTRPIVDSQSKKLPPRPVADWAKTSGLALYEPSSINDPTAVDRLRGLNADLLFVCDYGQILSADCLSTTRLGGINLHGSLLPRHRGAAPVQWSLLCGDQVAGVTVIHMTPKLDAGPALAVRSTDILPDETAGQLEPRLAQLGVSATEQSVRLLETWDGRSAIGQIQNQNLVTRAPRFAKRDGQLDFRLPAEYLVRLVRACQPWPGTYADLVWPNGKGQRVLVRSARSLPSHFGAELTVGQAQAQENRAADCCYWPQGGGQLLAVQTGSGTMLISHLQPAGKREMEVAEFLRGHPLEPGTGFRLPESPLVPLAAMSLD